MYKRQAEYAGALDQLEALAGQFAPGDVLIFRGEGRDTPDLSLIHISEPTRPY